MWFLSYVILKFRARDLSGKSRNGKDTKKIRENSSTSLSDETFEGASNSQGCAKIISSCLKQIESDVKKLFELHKESKNAQIKVKLN